METRKLFGDQEKDTFKLGENGEVELFRQVMVNRCTDESDVWKDIHAGDIIVFFLVLSPTGDPISNLRIKVKNKDWKDPKEPQTWWFETELSELLERLNKTLFISYQQFCCRG